VDRPRALRDAFRILLSSSPPELSSPPATPPLSALRRDDDWPVFSCFLRFPLAGLAVLACVFDFGRAFSLPRSAPLDAFVERLDGLVGFFLPVEGTAITAGVACLRVVAHRVSL
jgi:hypothetical protein